MLLDFHSYRYLYESMYWEINDKKKVMCECRNCVTKYISTNDGLDI